MRTLRKSVAGVSRNKVFRGTVLSIINDKVTVDIGEGRVVRMVPLTGGPVVRGDRVMIDYSSGSPIASAIGLVYEPGVSSVETVRRSSYIDPDVPSIANITSSTTPHDHSGDAGDGGQFLVANLLSTGAGSGTFLMADGANGLVFATPSIANSTDMDAIHDNVANEISAVTAKVTPVSADIILIEDSADGYSKKKITIGDLPGGTGTGGSGFYGDVLADEYLTSGSAATFDLQNIPSTYDRLEITIHGRQAGASLGGIQIALNNDTTSANYYRTRAGGTGTWTQNSAEDREIGYMPGSGNSIYFGTVRIIIENPGSTNLVKILSSHSHCRASLTSVGLYSHSLCWESTFAIDRITFTATYTGFAQYTNFRVIGYRNH